MQWQAKSERKVREKVKGKAVAKAMKVWIVQGVVYGMEHKPKMYGMKLFSFIFC